MQNNSSATNKVCYGSFEAVKKNWNNWSTKNFGLYQWGFQFADVFPWVPPK